MKKFVLFIGLIVLLINFAKAPAYADTSVAGSSAALFVDKKEVKLAEREKKVKNFLSKYNSPLTPYSDQIVTLADKYQIDWRLVVSIAGVESTFCKAIPYNSYNCWGWRNGKHAFSSFPDGLETVSRTLGMKYYARGFDTPEAIGPIYAPPTPSWAWKVRYFMNLLEDDASSTFLAKQFSI